MRPDDSKREFSEMAWQLKRQQKYDVLLLYEM